MPGFFSRVGTYMAGQAPKIAAAGNRASGAVLGAAMGMYGRTIQGAMIGGAAGAIYGSTNRNGGYSTINSIGDGMLAGAILGGLGARYIGAGLSAARRVPGALGRNAKMEVFERAVAAKASKDWRTAKLHANNMGRQIRGLFR